MLRGPWKSLNMSMIQLTSSKTRGKAKKMRVENKYSLGTIVRESEFSKRKLTAGNPLSTLQECLTAHWALDTAAVLSNFASGMVVECVLESALMAKLVSGRVAEVMYDLGCYVICADLMFCMCSPVLLLQPVVFCVALFPPDLGCLSWVLLSVGGA
ncbi:hypothetical protein CsSME_00009280 [Camellia sinensis var. sinensis]